MSKNKKMVEMPSHYELNPNFEVRDVINAFLKKLILNDHVENYDVFIDHIYEFSNSLKYILRAPFKENALIDIEKSIFCLKTIRNRLLIEAERKSYEDEENNKELLCEKRVV